MPLKVKWTGDSPTFAKIINNDEAYRELHILHEGFGFQLVGHCGENCIAVFVVGRQDGTTHILVCHSQVDCDTATVSKVAKWADEEKAINELIAQIRNVF